MTLNADHPAGQPTRRTRRTRRNCVLAIAALAIVGLAPAARAAEVLAADAQAVRAVIEAQWRAFDADDAKRAFSHAAPAIQAQFGTAEVFLAAVRQSYPAVYRRRSVAFFKPESSDGVLVQKVRLTDADGRAWIAAYGLQRAPGGAWRIHGCVVTEATERVT